MMPKFRAFSFPVVGLMVALTSGASAQDGDDWSVITNPDRDMTTAAVAYSGGVLLRIECQAGRLAVGISGIQARARSGRQFDRTLNDGKLESSFWILSEDGTTLTSASAARDARSLRSGGRLVLDTPSSEANSVRVRLDLPTQSTGIDTVLTACDRPLIDPRDDIPDVEPFLISMPGIEASYSAERYDNMIIEISCLIANSRLSACQSDHQLPNDERVGRDTARRAEGKRVELSDPAAAEGRRVDIVVTTFRVRR